MASNLNNLKVFSDFAYTEKNETERQQTELFNERTRGALTMSTDASGGDFMHSMFLKKIASISDIASPYTDAAVGLTLPEQVDETQVKYGIVSKQIQLDEHSIQWINESPEEFGVKVGEQVAKRNMQLKLNAICAALVACIGGARDGTTNIPGSTLTVNKIREFEGDDDRFSPTIDAMLEAQGIFGDAQQDIICWVMNGKTWTAYARENAKNNQELFTYQTLNVTEDTRGVPIVVTDSSALSFDANLETADSSGTRKDVEVQSILGLTAGAGMTFNQGDYRQVMDTSTDRTWIRDTWKAQETVRLGCKGYAYQVGAANANKGPTEAQLGMADRWAQVASDIKDTAGVLLNVAF